jgi:diguanylate cyclase (GGDEF)-like protein
LKAGENMPVSLQLSVYSVFILILILVNLKREHHLLDFKVKIFRSMILAVLTYILMDILFISLDGTTYFFTNGILVYGNALQYAIMCLIVFLWYFYNDFYIFKDMPHFKKWLPITTIPLLLHVALSLLSPWFGFFYTITPENIYMRGELFYLAAIFTYFYPVLTAFVIHFNRKKIRKADYAPLMFFIIPPAFAGLFQTLNYGVLLIGPSITFSFLVAFVYIQSKNMELDFLTGLYSRKELEFYFDILGKRKNSKKRYGGMMIDIDNFKGINDSYGHDTGDKVLREVSEIFQKSFRNSDFVSRVGGDEFVAICEVQSLMELEIIINRIRLHLDMINSLSYFPFKIQLSIGYDLWDTKSISKEEFMINIDKKMYSEKDAKK